MTFATAKVIFGVLALVRSMGALLLVLAALVVLLLTVRARANRLPAALLAAAYGVIFVLSGISAGTQLAGDWLVGTLASGVSNLIGWTYILVHVGQVVATLVVGVALVLFRPEGAGSDDAETA